MSRDKDQLADALHAMMGGHAGDEPHADPQEARDPIEPAAPSEPVPAIRPHTQAAATRSQRPSAPTPPAPTPAVRPVSTTSSVRAARPAIPSAMPATSVSSPAPVPPVAYAPRERVQHQPSFFGSLRFRQTLIPPCLVVGVALILLTILFYLQSPSTPLRQANPILPLGMGASGVVISALGVLNMLMVRKELRRSRPISGAN